MKRIIVTCIALLALTGCAQKTKSENMEGLTYQASSRGFFLEIVITNSRALVLGTRGGRPTSIPISKSEWTYFKEWVEHSDLDFNSSRSGKEEIDAAIPATLKIAMNNRVQTYEFDHGNPPKELNALLDKMLSYSK